MITVAQRATITEVLNECKADGLSVSAFDVAAEALDREFAMGCLIESELELTHHLFEQEAAKQITASNE